MRDFAQRGEMGVQMVFLQICGGTLWTRGFTRDDVRDDHEQLQIFLLISTHLINNLKLLYYKSAQKLKLHGLGLLGVSSRQ